jgi:hypothetical protein
LDLETVAAEWRAAQRSVEPADRDAAARAFEALYRASGWRPPRRIVWFDSPAAAAPAVVALREPALFTPGVDHADAPAVRAKYPAGVWERLQRSFSRRVRDRIKHLVDEAVGERVARTPALQRAGCGQHDALWVGGFDAGRRVFGVEQPRGIDGWAALARACGWWWAFRETAIACERQTLFRIDERDRLHALDGAALRFSDGFELYAIHGVRVEPWMVEQPERIDAETISSQRNSEVRRVLMERYGVARYLDDSRAQAIATDRCGSLYRLPAPHGGEPLVLVKVRNATPEPDGTWKDYFLRVPPSVGSPREAVAWTFGLEPAAYAPVVET